MIARTPVVLTVNGAEREAKAALEDTLLTVLRDHFLLTAAKRGCNHGVCGACTVLVDDRPVRACLSLALDCVDSRIDTIEGLCADRTMQALQRAFVASAAFQCGFCTPGTLVSAYGLLRETASPTEEEICNALSGNLCRCTGYRKIIEAVLAAARELREEVSA
jgi:carbon-monoxide dehydrogenase small subunit